MVHSHIKMYRISGRLHSLLSVHCVWYPSHPRSQTRTAFMSKDLQSQLENLHLSNTLHNLSWIFAYHRWQITELKSRLLHGIRAIGHWKFSSNFRLPGHSILTFQMLEFQTWKMTRLQPPRKIAFQQIA